MLILFVFHGGTFKRVVFFCFVSIFLVSQPAHAQTPACAVAGDAGNSYETCTSGVCENFVCNGSAFVTLSSRAFAGWESIKFGNDTQTCNSARSGRLRYTGGSTWQYCNGTSWSALGAGAGDGPTYLIGSGSLLTNPGSYTVAGSLTVPASTILTTKPFKFIVHGTYSHNGSTGRTIYARMTYGGTSITPGGGAATPLTIMAGSFVYEGTIFATSTTAAFITQELRAYNSSGDLYDSTITAQNYTIPSTTSSRTLSIDLSMNFSHATNYMTADKYYIEY